MTGEKRDRVAGKIALVTGGASNPGIGRSIALALAREGASVVVTDIDGEGAVRCADEITTRGGTALAFSHDVASETDWQTVIGETRAAFSGLDILVNNAGIAILKPLKDLTTEEWNRQIDVNLTSVFYGCKYGLELMRETGGGSIINLSSIAGHVGNKTTAAYAAAKGGVLAMSRSIAVEEAKHNIRCNTIHPGMIWTNMQAGAMGSHEAASYKPPAFVVPMERQGTPEEIASMALFLASDEASYITGAAFTVDGGMTTL